MRDAYLAGAYQDVPGGGLDWRNDFTAFYREIGYEAYDPLGSYENAMWEGISYQVAALKAGVTNSKTVQDVINVARQIVRTDLQALASCKTLVVYYDQYARNSAGTLGEIAVAKYLKIPVHIVLINQTTSQLPTWVLGCQELIFDTIEEFKNFMRKKASLILGGK